MKGNIGLFQHKMIRIMTFVGEKTIPIFFPPLAIIDVGRLLPIAIEIAMTMS
jgi:hypothetical protein